MAVLFGTDFTSAIGGAFAGQLLPGTLHKASTTRTESGATVATFVDHPCEGVRSKWSLGQSVARGYPANTVKLLVLQASLAVAPGLDDEITLAGGRYRVVDVDQDAGGATWSVFGAGK